MTTSRTATSNPWLEPLRAPATEVGGDPVEAGPLPLLTGAAGPQPGSVAPDTDPGLATFSPTGTAARLWVAGVHGGAGEHTVGALLEGSPTGQRWPADPVTPLVLVARTNLRGLSRLQQVATAWAADRLPAAPLLGAVLVADAPGRTPRALADLARLVAGGVPHVWELEWREQLRTAEMAEVSATRRWRKVRRELDRLIAAASAGALT